MSAEETEFLMEEYKEAISTGQWLEESIRVAFKNLGILFIWQMGLIGFLLERDTSIQKKESILIMIQQCQSKQIILLSSTLILVFSILTVINMFKARKGDVERTSRINFLRGYFLKNMPNDFKTKYFENGRLKDINSTDIGKRPLWSLGSDLTLYGILSLFIGIVSIAVIYNAR